MPEKTLFCRRKKMSFSKFDWEQNVVSEMGRTKYLEYSESTLCLRKLCFIEKNNVATSCRENIFRCVTLPVSYLAYILLFFFSYTEAIKLTLPRPLHGDKLYMCDVERATSRSCCSLIQLYCANGLKGLYVVRPFWPKMSVKFNFIVIINRGSVIHVSFHCILHL